LINLAESLFHLCSGSSSDDQKKESEGIAIDVDTIEHAFTDLFFSEEIDEFWVLGETATTPFDELTVQERQLIKWRFIDKKRSSEIALKITEHPNTVREHITKIKTKLREIIIKNNSIDGIIIPIKFDKD
jgi:hypothetical protein